MSANSNKGASWYNNQKSATRALNFGIPYGMGDTKLASMLNDEIGRQTAYDNGYKEAMGMELDKSRTLTNEMLNDKFQSSYIDGFMVGLGERDVVQ